MRSQRVNSHRRLSGVVMIVLMVSCVPSPATAHGTDIGGYMWIGAVQCNQYTFLQAAEILRDHQPAAYHEILASIARNPHHCRPVADEAARLLSEADDAARAEGAR